MQHARHASSFQKLRLFGHADLCPSPETQLIPTISHENPIAYRAMLSFDIRELESKAAQVHDDLPATDPVWGDNDSRPIAGVHVEGRLAAAGDARFYFSGRISGMVPMNCRRCPMDVTMKVNEDVNFLVAPIGDPTAEDDPDVYLYDSGAHNLDLKAAVRENWLLAVPAFAQCKPDCQGLCPHCGTDLNANTCSCVPAKTDNRWDALRKGSQSPSQA